MRTDNESMNQDTGAAEARSPGAGPNERGAVLVEAAIAIPLLLLIFFGALEFGSAWEARSSSTSAVRTGLLRAASLGDRPETDLAVLQSVIGEIGADKVDNIDWIVIFDATDPNRNATIDACAAAVASNGQSGVCNAYGPTELQSVVAGTLTTANFDDGANTTAGGYTCDGTKIDSNWCAPGRTIDGGIALGVAVRYNHESYTGILPGDGVSFTEHAVSSTLLRDQAEALGGNGGLPFVQPSSSTTPSPTSSTPPTVPPTITTTTTTTTIPPTTTQPPEVIVYSNAIQRSRHLDDWSDRTITRSRDNDRLRVLGPFGTESVTLNLDNLPTHNQVCVEFELYLIDSWDGDHDRWGDDYFGVRVDGTEQFRDFFRQGDPRSEGAEHLGFGTTKWKETVVPMRVCDDNHTASSASFQFFGHVSEGIDNESWAIDNVRVITR